MSSQNTSEQIQTHDRGGRPIIAFARIGRMALLRQVLGELVVPNAVYDDLVVKGRGKPGANEVAGATWIRRGAIQDLDAALLCIIAVASMDRPISRGPASGR